MDTDTDQLEAQQTDDATDSAQEDGEQSRMPEMFRTALDRIVEQTTERPLVVMAAAGGVGYVLGRGLPRLRGMLWLAGIGGLVGYGITAMRRRMGAGASDAEEQQDESATDSAADDESFDSAAMPQSSMPRSSTRARRKKKKHAAPAAT
jgi:hypothetical protein